MLTSGVIGDQFRIRPTADTSLSPQSIPHFTLSTISTRLALDNRPTSTMSGHHFHNAALTCSTFRWLLHAPSQLDSRHPLLLISTYLETPQFWSHRASYRHDQILTQASPSIGSCPRSLASINLLPFPGLLLAI
jgi:hypothetical protein